MEPTLAPLGYKLLFALAIFVAGWAGGWIPLRGSGEGKNDRFTSWGNAFAAGIFLGTGLIHLLGEAQVAWTELGWTYPVAPLLAVCGFMITLLFEHVLIPHEAHHLVHAHSGEPLSGPEIERLASARYPYVLLFTLSVHSVLAGLALGVQDSLSGAFFIFVAIIAHKSTAAFSLGISLARSRVPLHRSRRHVLVFSLTTPIGIVLGAAASHLFRSAVGAYFDATFLALAAGTFLYIAAVDIIQDEFLRAGGRLAKWLWAAAAVALMALLSRWI
jgi:zinc transporter 1/2/3